jgi:hypothetical protein
VESLREALTVVQAARWFDRFHSFGIDNDECPACGGRVVVEETPRLERGKRVASGIRLRAVPWS